ncbi:MAG: ShlB/FhaC/HecB family hemolysin secretion/activation protein [Nostocaceae cyanobacterium]|nr:ShlB/FhaC/HecB family hemolysin secretion/activation protein [Nostocaceae cyanobacterium]
MRIRNLSIPHLYLLNSITHFSRVCFWAIAFLLILDSSDTKAVSPTPKTANCEQEISSQCSSLTQEGNNLLLDKTLSQEKIPYLLPAKSSRLPISKTVTRKELSNSHPPENTSQSLLKLKLKGISNASVPSFDVKADVKGLVTTQVPSQSGFKDNFSPSASIINTPTPQDITPPASLNRETQSKSPLLPPPEELLNPSSLENLEAVPGKITVERFEVEGNTVFSQEELDEVLKPFLNRTLSFAELVQARSAITQLYVDKGYVTSGALLPPQTLADGVVKIQVIEGGLESINVSGLNRLNSSYVRSRLALATKKPVNVPRLMDSLRVLQLDPLIQNLSAELSAGSRPGQNVLDINVKEGDTFGTQFTIDNGRSPSVGSFRRRAQLNQGNLLGFGDALSIGYTNTDGSNGLDVSYSLPINARNGTLSFGYGNTSSNVIEDPFNSLDIISNSRYYELTFRQPLLQTPSKEFTLGITASRRESETSLLDTPFPLSPGADEEGRTRISALRFFQEWTQRNSKQVFAARSQFNIGMGAFNATINQNAPDSRFLSWRGQAQWVRLLAPDTLFFLRGDIQLADNTLLPTEQFGLGGLGSVRGYRQDFLLTDNGVLLSAEVRLPVFKSSQTLVQVVPFIDFGTAWNSGSSDTPANNTLAAVGLGLQMSLGNSFTARLDWGLPLVDVDTEERTWQENGLYFSITSSPF